MCVFPKERHTNIFFCVQTTQKQLSHNIDRSTQNGNMNRWRGLGVGTGLPLVIEQLKKLLEIIKFFLS